MEAESYFINDKSVELISLYNNIKGAYAPHFFDMIEGFINSWNLLTEFVKEYGPALVDVYCEYAAGSMSDNDLKRKLLVFVDDNYLSLNELFSTHFKMATQLFLIEIETNVLRKMERMKALEEIKGSLPVNDRLDNIEAAFKSAFYMFVRNMYNNASVYDLSAPVQSAVFLFIRNYAYSGMFRYSKSGNFNVPYGGIAYNRKDLQKKISYLKSNPLQELLGRTTIANLDFEDFFKTHTPQSGDFVFLDPPYDSEFSTYAQNEFTKQDQTRLASCLIDECRANWMMIIKNTDFIKDLYSEKGLNIQAFDKTYLVSFMNRNDKSAEHLLITNY
jgi:DNA adenine methylase